MRQEERVLVKIYIDRSSTRSKSSDALGYKKRTVKLKMIGADNLLLDIRAEAEQMIIRQGS